MTLRRCKLWTFRSIYALDWRFAIQNIVDAIAFVFRKSYLKLTHHLTDFFRIRNCFYFFSLFYLMWRFVNWIFTTKEFIMSIAFHLHCFAWVVVVSVRYQIAERESLRRHTFLTKTELHDYVYFKLCFQSQSIRFVFALFDVKYTNKIVQVRRKKNSAWSS